MKSLMIPLVMIGLLLSLIGGCIDTENPTEKAASEIENFLTSFNWNSEQWRTAIEKLSKDLTTVEANAAQDVKDVVAKSIATGGQEIRCNVDFMRNRARQDLQRIANRLRGKPIQLPDPHFCAVVPPDGIDMARRPKFLSFYGYDFKVRERDRADPSTYREIKQVRAYLAYSGGPEIPLDDWTDFPTHYLLTIKTAEHDTIPLCNKENRHVILRANDGTELSSIGVAKAACPPAPPAPPPLPEKNYYTHIETFSAGIGDTDNREFGGDCSQGYRRARYSINAQNKKRAGCYFDHWVGDEHSCKINVRFWADPLGKVDCEIKIFEKGEQLPPPPPPPCPCR